MTASLTPVSCKGHGVLPETVMPSGLEKKGNMTLSTGSGTNLSFPDRIDARKRGYPLDQKT